MGCPGASLSRGNCAPGNVGGSLGEDLWAKAQGLATEVSTRRLRGQSSALHARTGKADKERRGRRRVKHDADDAGHESFPSSSWTAHHLPSARLLGGLLGERSARPGSLRLNVASAPSRKIRTRTGSSSSPWDSVLSMSRKRAEWGLRGPATGPAPATRPGHTVPTASSGDPDRARHVSPPPLCTAIRKVHTNTVVLSF